MTFIDFLMTSTKRDGSPLRQRTVEHYSSGLKAISDDMMREKVISKPLMLMDAFELDVAIAFINFPKSFDHIVFIRGSGIDSLLKPCCIQGIHMYRQYIWIKGKYMVDRLKKTNLI